MNKPTLLMDSDRSASALHQSLKGWQPLGKNWRCSAPPKVRCPDAAMDRSRLVRVVLPTDSTYFGDFLVTQELNALVLTEAYNPYWSRIGHSTKDIRGL